MYPMIPKTYGKQTCVLGCVIAMLCDCSVDDLRPDERLPLICMHVLLLLFFVFVYLLGGRTDRELLFLVNLPVTFSFSFCDFSNSKQCHQEFLCVIFTRLSANVFINIPSNCSAGVSFFAVYLYFCYAVWHFALCFFY